MWIVKTLGRRTRAGVDRVYSINGAFVTHSLEQAATEAMDCFKDEIASSVDALPPFPVIENLHYIGRDVRPQDTEDYWNCTGAWSKAS